MAAERNCFDSASRSKIQILQFREAIPGIPSVFRDRGNQMALL